MSSTPTQDLSTLLNPFLTVLQARSPILIPQETLYGALTHFLSHLPNSQLPSLITTVVSSPSLWLSSEHVDGVREAFRVSVSTKCSDSAGTNRWFGSFRRQRESRAWLSAVAHPIVSSENSISRVACLTGLLQGLHEVDVVDWGSGRDDVEEEVAVLLADAVERGPLDQADETILLYMVVPCLSKARLKALSLLEVSLCKRNGTEEAETRV